MHPAPRCALVTGANQGIGKEIARQLIASTRFATVLLGCRDVVKGQATAAELNAALGGSTAVAVHLDLTAAASVSELARHVVGPTVVCLWSGRPRWV